MDFVSPPKKPLIISQLSADILSQRQQAVRSKNITDGDGLTWKLKVIQHQKPHETDPKKLVWVLIMSLHCRAEIHDLVKPGTLREKEDSRLIKLLEREQEDINFCVKPRRIEGVDEDEVLRQARKSLPPYIEAVSGKSLLELKRAVICRLIEKRCHFGHSHLTSPGQS